jgi:SAM-dependent methyltransferase
MNKAGFEYKNKKKETPFETFLRYTNQKEKSAVKLAAILKESVRGGSHILDVGTGNGQYLQLALSKLNLPEDMTLTLVEPSEDLVAHLERRFAGQLSGLNLRVVRSDLQNFDSDRRFDVILMSHLFYHIPRSTWTEQLTKALSLLKHGGLLIVVLREKDDAYDFKMAFKPLLFAKLFKALTIDDVLAVLPKDGIAGNTKHIVESELKIPFAKNLEDTIAIIEFYLNKHWEEMPQPIQREALEFIKNKRGKFKQRDCIAVIRTQ